MKIQEAYDIIFNVNYEFNYTYGLSFISPDRYSRVRDALSYLRRVKELDGHEYHFATKIFEHSYNNYYKVKHLESIEPRKIAQRFIGRKKIREFIFKRDGYKCLKCTSEDNLTIDHIEPIHTGGENKLSNLQTLCKSCNSSKSSNYKDYR